MFNKNTSIKLFSLVAIVLLFLSFLVATNIDVKADKETDLRSQATQLEDEIAANEARLAQLNEESNTLKAKIAELQTEINTAAKQIELTQVKIQELEIEIEKTELELERQKDILKHALVTLYKEGNITTIEMLASSESYTDFINQQEYLSRLKDQIHDSAKQVEELKDTLEKEKVTQDELLLELESHRDILASKQTEQQRTLDRTQGEEARYQAIIEDLRAQKEAAEAALNAYLASLINNAVSLGPVNKGEVIGALGNTGYSSGPHLHLKVYTPDTIGPGVDPISTMNQFGWQWPVSGGGVLTQGWGCSGLGVYSWYNGCPWHDAIDVAAPQGTPLVAIADGEVIHRGCAYVGTIFSNFMVIIDHGNGYYSLYAHMVAPDDPSYNACRGNTYY